MASTVYVVHCIDTEGPLYESLEATFNRLKEIFGLRLEPSEETLRQLQRGELDLEVDEEAVQQVVDPHLLDYNDTWTKLDAMLDDILSSDFRSQFPDSVGNGWLFNWFLLDHVGYHHNPRRRTMGYHAILDHYRSKLTRTDSEADGVHFHYHPHPFKKQAHRCARHWWAGSDTLYQILCRRIIDRHWFPAANRPGFGVTRPDSHWFLEQFVPFDYANEATESTETDEEQFDLTRGQFSDWRRAPRTWEPYHPSHDDYQTRGDCRRWIARCLNIGTRGDLLSESDIRQAFEEARSGKPVVMAITNHDFRDIRRDIEAVHGRISSISEEFPSVDFEYREAVQAMRDAIDLEPQVPCNLDIDIRERLDSKHLLHIRTDVPTFGPQPFLALKTKGGVYYHDNLDFQEPHHEWTYVFDDATFDIGELESIGVAANNAYGTTTVAVVDADTLDVTRNYLNASV